MVGLCSKTYIGETESGSFKYSCKGINKRLGAHPMQKYSKVLKTGECESSVNKGFRVKGDDVYSYVEERIGFSYFYCKRLVSDDGVHTSPLNVTLSPWDV